MTGPAPQAELQSLTGESDSTKQFLAVLRGALERATCGGVHVVEEVDIGIDGEKMLTTSRDQLVEVRRINLGHRELSPCLMSRIMCLSHDSPSVGLVGSLGSGPSDDESTLLESRGDPSGIGAFASWFMVIQECA